MKTLTSKNIIFMVLVVVSLLLALGLMENSKDPGTELDIPLVQQSNPVNNDFVYAARIGAPAVVHIKTKVPLDSRQYEIPSPFREFFDNDFWERFFNIPEKEQQTPQFTQASGSGVIVEESGIIVTNNHVIHLAEEIEVILHDQRSYQGKLIGADPLTDLAVLKIDEEKLSYLKFGNSDLCQVGEWVLAVGNPFYGLSSTVTAGIISAKARNLNLLQDQAAIESFIQTDAAVNRGNSGGALLNTKGELIGINTAIASPTGVYAGYAFAIPSNIVKKVVDDLINYGAVARAYLGVFIRNLDGGLIKEKGLQITEGVLVDSLVVNGAASKAGIKPGDIIVKIDDQPVSNASQLQAKIGIHRPEDIVQIVVNRNGKKMQFKAHLKSLEQQTATADN